MTDQSTARRVMVDNQIRTFDVTDRAVIAAFETVPREQFVAARDQAIAYSDRVLTVGDAPSTRTLLAPLVLARLIQALQPAAGERALDVLGGLGYSAAILAAIGLEVSSVEADPALTERARAAHAALGTGVTVLPAEPVTAEGGARGAKPGFDLILINGASAREPAGFFPLLKDGGRLGVIQPVGKAFRALVYLAANGHVSPRRAFDTEAPILPGFAASPGFVF